MMGQQGNQQEKYRIKSMTETCDTFPNCPAAQIATEQVEQKNEINKKLDIISLDLKEISLRFSDDLKEFAKSLSDFGLKLADIRPIAKELEYLKTENKEAHDFFGEQLRKHDAFKAEKKELIKLESDLREEIRLIASERISWKTKIIFAGVTAFLMVVMFMVGYFTK